MSDTYFRSKGSSQNSRLFEAMKEGYVKIDERSFEDLLVFTSRLAKMINFYDENNRLNGNWAHFFADETVLLATIIDTNPAKIEKRFKKNLKKIRLFKKPEKKSKYLQKTVKEIFTMAKRFEYWYDKFGEIEEFSQQSLSIRNEIANAIMSKLAIVLAELKIICEKHPNMDGMDVSEDRIDFSLFSSIWSDELNHDSVDQKQVINAEQLVTDEEYLLERLQYLFQSFYETLLYLKAKTPSYLEKSMESEIHFPETALFLSFVKLYEHTQNNINKLTDRHLAFYFRQILRQIPKDKKLSSVYLQFVLDNEIDFVKLDAGTDFIGEDPISKDDVVYSTEEDLLINRATIEKVYSIFVEQEPLFYKGEVYKKINNILHADLPLTTLTPKKDITQKLQHAPFGEDQRNKGASEKSMHNAPLGFAFSSYNLFMDGGLREVELVIKLTSESYKSVLQKLDVINLTDKDEEARFLKAFSDSFHIAITSSEGWLPIEKYVVKKSDKENSLIFSFDIKNSDPSIIGFTPDVHAGAYDAGLPIVKFSLNSNSFIYAYTLFSQVVVEQVWFNVAVSNLKNLLLYNNIGQLSPNSPFLPFGPTPKQGAYFIIGNNEALNKSLDDFSVNIEWFDLPGHKDGFSQHYSAYNSEMDNASFEVSLAVLDNGSWKPEESENQQKLKLFRTESNGIAEEPDAAGRLLSKSEFNNIDVKRIKQSAEFKQIGNDLQLTNLSKRGFVKLELTAPHAAFGHDIYPAILSETVMENAKSGLLKSKKFKEMPLQPYTPQIKNISINYSSSAAISMADTANVNSSATNEQGRVYHLHPFGINKVFPSTSGQNIYLLPEYDFEGSMHLGISGLNPPQKVSILFEMIDEYTESSEEELPVIEWSYLKENKWQTLAPSRIIKDETNRFLKTGIVVIDVPSDIKTGNTVFDEDLFWIRASVIKNLDTVSSLLSITSNVVTAKLSNVENLPANYLDNDLPAFSITRSINNIRGIRSVSQPLPSFGGISAEATKKFQIRVGERLRHKSRAITAWDYERILLEQFPEIEHVTCLTNMTSNSTDKPGNILMVVKPQAKYSANVNEPMASSELLFKIKNYLTDFSSPFVKVEVRNPNYERIKIICAVKFSDGYNYGFFIQKLNEQINQYLRGTLLTQNKKVELGGSIHSSDILSFMRTLPYVSFITKFSMIQVSRDLQGKYHLMDTAREGGSSSYLQATKPWSVLVPAPEHQLSVIVSKAEERSRQAGIDYLELGHDFIIEE